MNEEYLLVCLVPDSSACSGQKTLKRSRTIPRQSVFSAQVGSARTFGNYGRSRWSIVSLLPITLILIWR